MAVKRGPPLSTSSWGPRLCSAYMLNCGTNCRGGGASSSFNVRASRLEFQTNFPSRVPNFQTVSKKTRSAAVSQNPDPGTVEEGRFFPQRTVFQTSQQMNRNISQKVGIQLNSRTTAKRNTVVNASASSFCSAGRGRSTES